MRGGLIDLGSNSFRLLVADAAGPVEKRAHFLGLARSVSTHGSLTPDDLRHATRRAAELLWCARDLECDRIAVVATEAFRFAANGPAAVEHLAHQLDHPVRLLSVAEETSLAFRGALPVLPDAPAVTVLDLGGGSLGIASGATGQARPEVHFSYPFGVEMLAPRVLDDEWLPTGKRIKLEHHLAGEFQPVAATLAGLGDRPIIAVGGAARALARVIHTARRGQVPETADGLTIDSTDLGHLIGRLSELGTRGRQALPGMPPHRAATMPLAATILRQALRSIGIERAIVSTAGLREGALQQQPQQLRRAA